MNAAAETPNYNALIQEAHAMRSEYVTSAFRGLFKALFAPLTRMSERRHLRAAFAGMDDRLLQDIGLTRGDIEASVNRCLPRRSLVSYLAAAAGAFGSVLRGNAEQAAVMELTPHLRRDIGAEDTAAFPVKRTSGRIFGGLADPLHGNTNIINDTHRRAA